MSKRARGSKRVHSAPSTPHRRLAGGWGLTETLLTVGAISAMSVAVYMALHSTDAAAQVKIEQSNLRDLSRAVDRSIGLLGSFEGISAARTLDDELAPPACGRPEASKPSGARPCPSAPSASMPTMTHSWCPTPTPHRRCAQAWHRPWPGMRSSFGWTGRRCMTPKG